MENTFNLIDRAWLPARRVDGSVEHIRPADITSDIDGNPIMAVDWPRADFRVAAIEFLIGLIATACPPADDEEAWLEGWDKPRIQKRVRELLSLVGLDAERFSQRYPHELSGGQRQRVGVARALAADPPLLLMDEPFGALDPLTRASLQKEFAELKARLGKTVLFVTHDVREALTLGARIGLMDTGRLLLVESPEGFRQSDDKNARAYLETLKS